MGRDFARFLTVSGLRAMAKSRRTRWEAWQGSSVCVYEAVASAFLHSRQGDRGVRRALEAGPVSDRTGALVGES